MLVVLTGLFLLSATRSDAQIFHKKKKVNKSTSVDNTAEPDKVLYDKAIDDIKHGRHEVGRLNLQTLINTYPDSEYLAKAKLSIADSYYREGGKGNMTQAIQAYKDFGVFFPFMQEAAYAQLQVAMAHYKQMEKPDRDRTEALSAEYEFQIYLQKYPNDPLEGKAEQHLREVQEVLAEGDYRIGFYYYVKGDKRAAESRLKSITSRYPLYSKSDQALWMLGNIWEGTEKREFASNYYAQIVRNYPLSPLVPNAKIRLKNMGAPVPQPDPKAAAWMTAEQNAPRPHNSLVKKPLAFFKNGPGLELQVASQTGKPTLEPESEGSAGTEILTGGGAPGKSGTGIVATVTPGSGGGTGSPSGTAEEVAPVADGSAPNSGAQTDPNAARPPEDPNKAAAAVASDPGKPAAASDPANGSGTAPAGTAEAAPKTDAGKATEAAKTDAAPAQNGDDKKESTSKKKKGLRKLIPW